MYVALPYEVASSLDGLPRIVVPARKDDSTNRPPVYLRFHTAQHAPAHVDLRAFQVASRRVGYLRRSLRHRHSLQTLQQRAIKTGRAQVSVVEIETAIPAEAQRVFTAFAALDSAEYSLAALNRFLDTYQVLTEQVEVHHLNLENVGPELVLELRRRSDKPTGRFKLPHKSRPLPGEQGPPAEHLLPVLEDAMRREVHQHPMDLVRLLYLRACRFADTGEYQAAIIFLQSSVERLVFALHTLARVDAGATADAIELDRPKVFGPALKQLAHSFGGNWSTTGPGPVAQYWQAVYLARNRIAHAGASPTRDDVPDAFEAYERLWDFVLDRVAAQRRRLPRTALAVHGTRGLQKRGMFDEPMTAFVTQLRSAGEEDWFWLPADTRADLAAERDRHQN